MRIVTCDIPEYGLKKGDQVKYLADGEPCGQNFGVVIEFSQNGKWRKGWVRRKEIE